MSHINADAISNMTQRFKVNLINSLPGFKSANLIGTANSNGQTNLAVFSSVIHLGSDPALIGFITRPHSVPRHTLENIKQTRYYTINQINTHIWRQAHQTSARYLRDESEFEQVNLTPTYLDNFHAPFVKESKLNIGLELTDIIPIKANNTEMVIGQVTDIHVVKEAICDDGYLDIEKLQTVAISGLDSYHDTQRKARLSYAKTDSLVTELK